MRERGPQAEARVLPFPLGPPREWVQRYGADEVPVKAQKWQRLAASGCHWVGRPSQGYASQWDVASRGQSTAGRWVRAARLGWDVAEEVRVASWRWAGARTLGRESEMGEDPADHTRILNGRDQAHAAATARTREDIKLEGAPHEVRPRPIARRAGSFLLELRDAARARVKSACFHQRGLRALVGHGAGAPASMGGEDSMVQHEIDAGARDQGGELLGSGADGSAS